MKLISDIPFLEQFAKDQQEKADKLQSEAAKHQSAAAAARRRIKQLKREGREDGS